ncbi:hypothetical protein COCSUDRAFT_43486 [Coccomyxa subellipsoidea C-169]|uniref:DNA-directed primase/polymerase protein n=1 Tax=Coccomyxa subellipsoidea (strain C-169) TaxID=574566 RepID=I0YRX7_COCSC|nr:hypothetical protein COCSUDRAFT_43486 [Coccomyxa subellipsoidea C-169]EIE21146.1 hypothetical protein COCSUDRAFT_43486 [Coccomyxa subellipsoidea C-169]|eukprot:XP_005645690.1 hypothetical protein COCSUDRAFT_43486 [Coccomyxa subellipsoidea C-169]
MPGVKRPAETLVKTIIGGDGQVPSVENPDATATIELAQQTPKQKTRSFSQRQVAFVDLTADDSDEPGQQDCASADDASPMSIARSFTDQASTPGGSSTKSLPSGSPMAISPLAADPCSPAEEGSSPCNTWQPRPSRFQPVSISEDQDIAEGPAGDGTAARELGAEQMQEEEEPGRHQPSADDVAAVGAADSEQPGPTEEHKAAAESYRAALAALNERTAPQEAPAPQAAPLLSSRGHAPAGLVEAQPVGRHPCERGGPARQPNDAGSFAWQRPRQAPARDAAPAAVTESASRAAALQEYKDALRVASGLPPEAPSTSFYAQKGSRAVRHSEAQTGGSARIYETCARQQEAADFADKCNRKLATEQQQHSNSMGLPGGAMCQVRQMAALPSQTVAAMEEGRAASAVARTAQAGDGGMDRCQQTEASTSASGEGIPDHVKVVREGRPCHMYFDLEYVPECNPLVDANMMVTILLNLVRMGLRELWGLQLEDGWVWELDSSSPAKWSRHIIVVVPGRAFPSNLALGAFVTQILSLPQAAQLRVEKTDGRCTGERHFTSIVDTAVYTKNRHFRTALSCKGGKGHVLQSTGRFAASQGSQLTERELFMRTLVCNVETGARPLACGAAEQLLRSRAGPSNRRTAQLSDSAEGLQLLQTAAAAAKVCWKRDALDDGLPLLAPIEELQRWGQQVVAFIEDVAKQRAGGAPATVRTIAHCGTAGLVAYSMLGPGSHWCENIGRCHASNHVFFVVSMSEGQYAQKCYDPDCAHFRSAWMPLPPHLLLSPDSVNL